jgi:hypothetical protein
MTIYACVTAEDAKDKEDVKNVARMSCFEYHEVT